MFLHVFCISAFARTLRKSSGNCFERPSRASHATENSRKTIFSSFRTPKWSTKSFWITSGGLLGLLWDPPGRQLDPLGAPLGPPWELGGRCWALLACFWRRFARKFSKLRLPDRILLDLGSIWGGKPAEFYQKPAKSWRKLDTSAANQTSDSNKGAAVARSELNPPHPTFMSGAKRSK